MNTKQIWGRARNFILNPKVKEILFLTFLFSISFLFRRIGLKHGFPLLTHPDEPISLNPVYHMTVNKTLNPADFKRPDQIHYFVYFFYLNIISFIRYGKSLADTFLQNQLVFYYYARLLIAVIGSIIPLVAYKIGKEFKFDFSIPAGLFFAFFPYYIVHSHFITPDITITLLTLVVILFSIRYLKQNKDKYIYLATIFTAINTAEKYPGLLSYGIVIVALFLSVIDTRAKGFKIDFPIFVKKLISTAGLFLFALFLSAPNVFIEYGKVIDSLIFEARSTHLGADNLGWGGNILFYIEQFVAESNLLIILFIFIGLFAVTKIKNRTGILLLYGLAYCVILSRLSLHWVRWALPMYTAPLLLASLGIGYAWKLIKENHKKIIKYFFIVVVFIAILQQAISGLADSSRMGFIDTRIAALNYCNENGITPENSIYEGYTPFSPNNYGVIFDTNIDELGNSIDYVILSSNMYNRFYYEADRYVDEVNFYKNIEREYPLIKEISPTPAPSNLREEVEDIAFYVLRYFNRNQSDRYTGPTIKIYEISK
jgi:hypothetical protein